MKPYIILPLWLLLHAGGCLAQRSALNIPGLHQLVSHSKSESELQNAARDKQAVALANESANKTQLARLKDVYRKVQQRYLLIGTAIDAASIGLQARPMVTRIARDQAELYHLASNNPALVTLAYQTQIEFGQKAYSLLNYLIGLCASLGDINQMKAGDRRMLFDFVISEISHLQSLSAKLVSSVRYGGLNALIRSVNPFQGFINQDIALVQDIIGNAKFIKP